MKVLHIPPDKYYKENLLEQGMTEETIKEHYRNQVNSILKENTMMENLKGAANIVTIEECKVEQDSTGDGYTIYIKMELLTSMHELLRNYQLGPDDIVKIGMDLCDGLIACEQLNIVHRDIKPANVFLNTFGTYKIGDFGIARQMEHGKTNMTQVGTSMYMAPELYGGIEADKRVDIYSLGIMLYRLANKGCFPFVDSNSISPETNQEALIKRLSGTPLPFPTEVDKELGRIILKACEKNPEDRYQSALQMKKAFEMWQARQLINEKTENISENVSSKNNNSSQMNEKLDKTALSPKTVIATIIAIMAIIVIVVATNKYGEKKESKTTIDNATQSTENKIIEESQENDTTASVEEFRFYENGEMAEIEDLNGKFKFGVTEATILKETGYRDAVYQLTWVTENENYAGSLATSAYDFKILDSDGFIVDAMNEGWEDEWSNNFEDAQPKAGEKCKSKHTYVINNPKCTYLDVSLEKYKITCRIKISNLENGESSIPENATDEQVAIIKNAINYVESGNFSRDGLIKQLEYEGYTNEEAQYGADNCGADWNEQAVKAAKNYMSQFDFSKEEMINQLVEGEYFTQEQAVYGAEHCGQY